MLSILRCCGSRIRPPIFTQRPYMKCSEKMELLLKQTDRVSKEHELIYKHPNTTQLSIMYHSVNFMSFMTASHLVYMGYCGTLMEMLENYFQLAAVVAFTGFVFISSQKLQRGFPLRIYYFEQDKKNTAIFIGKIPFTSESYDFSSKSIELKHKEPKFPWQNSVFKHKNRSLYLLENNFKTISNFYEMLKPEKS